ncbi:hypothetical protein GGX14DRAFT_592949 [Mycena pura]|uniref:USP domain-containing protein n=1 Tax=Mycena pura TaxID=153505 RepID=A0AAD6Y668_9AGAR|nr:hypothetical protein GGX14DRAFT_592949 [Mycena pura]
MLDHAFNKVDKSPLSGSGMQKGESKGHCYCKFLEAGIARAGEQCLLSVLAKCLARTLGLSLFCKQVATDTPRLQQPGVRASHLARPPRHSLSRRAQHSGPIHDPGVPSARPPSAPRRHPSSISPTASPVSALTAFWDACISSSTTPHIARAAALLVSHEHQDVQELFQLLSECVREENARVGREGARDHGFAGVTAAAPADDDAQVGVLSPFGGLTATRRACLHCGYTAATATLRLIPCNSRSRAPAGAGAGWCSSRDEARQARDEAMRERDELLAARGDEEDTKPAIDTTREGTLEAGPEIVRSLSVHDKPDPDLWPKSESMDDFAVHALHGTGDALKSVRIERVSGDVCTRESMLGRPPAVLALHMNRSVHTALRVAFPELLDLAPYTTDGMLSLDPTAALSDAAAHRGARRGRDRHRTVYLRPYIWLISQARCWLMPNRE